MQTSSTYGRGAKRFANRSFTAAVGAFNEKTASIFVPAGASLSMMWRNSFSQNLFLYVYQRRVAGESLLIASGPIFSGAALAVPANNALPNASGLYEYSATYAVFLAFYTSVPTHSAIQPTFIAFGSLFSGEVSQGAR